MLDLRPDPASMAFLLRVSEVLSSSLDLDDLMERTANVIRDSIEYDQFAILQLNESTQELRVMYTWGGQIAPSARRIAAGKGITGAAVLDRAPVIVNDVGQDDRYIAAFDGVRSELAVPLILKKKVIGVIDLQSKRPGHFTGDHAGLLVLVATRIAMAIENARLYRSTLRQAKTLATLTEISREFTSILKLDDLLRKVAELVRRLIAYDAFSVLLLDDRQEVLKHYLSIRFNERVTEKTNIPVGKGIIGHSVAERQSLLIPDVERDSRYINLNPATRSELAVPLVAKDRVIGVLDLEHTRRGFFTTRHLQTLELLAPQIGVAIENARLYEKLAREEERMERDLQAARELQAALLPPCCPDIPGLQICARYEPAREIGGDLYDFVDYDEAGDRGPVLGIFVGDVSGKGAPAALYAALSHGLLRTVAARFRPVSDTMAMLNRVLCERRIEARSLALSCALFDVRTRTLELANSGFPAPMICRGSEMLPLKVEGVPLGLLENVEYQSATVQLQTGDVVLFYSDGISENFNAAREEFGRARLRALLAANCDQPASVIVDRIFQEAQRWSDGVPISDDRTAVVLKIGEPGEVGGCSMPGCR